MERSDIECAVGKIDKIKKICQFLGNKEIIKILLEICRNEGITAQELINKIELTEKQIRSNLHKLKKYDFVIDIKQEEKQKETDKRKKPLMLSESGKSLLKYLREIHNILK